MSCQVVVDTHIVIWYLTDSSLLSSDALTALEDADTAGGIVFVSAITLIEICYLVEKGRIPSDVLTLLHSAINDPGSSFFWLT